ncbi:MAG: hypothetical protein PF542_00275 [Nanoarchaeota archaeon]|jgi:hypothetical protein|nr:hypothetical protein [Nanoarchaeota archaeon]
MKNKILVPQLISEMIIDLPEAYGMAKINTILHGESLERRLSDSGMKYGLTGNLEIPSFIKELDYIDGEDGMVYHFGKHIYQEKLDSCTSENQIKSVVRRIPYMHVRFPSAQEYLAKVDLLKLNYLSKGTIEFGKKEHISGFYDSRLQENLEKLKNIKQSKYIANNSLYFGPISIDAIAKDFWRSELNQRQKLK